MSEATRSGEMRSAPRMAVVVSMMSGLESFVKREVEALADRGYALKLFATKYTPSAGFEPRADIPFVAPSVLSVTSGFLRCCMRKPLLLCKLIAEACRFKGVIELLLATAWAGDVLRFDAQLIHCAFGDRKFFVGYFLHRLTGIPLTVAIHAHEIYAQPNPPLFRRALQQVAGIVTISARNRALLCERFGWRPEQIDVIRLTIDLDFWQPREQIKVLTVARYTPRKGWQELIEAARRLGAQFHFCAAGFGELDIEALARAAGVGDRFTVFPKLQPKHLHLLMQACDIFCLPSKPTAEEGSEGIPVVLMEAMAMGMPIVTTNDGSIDELVETEIAPAGDVEALVQALLRTAQHIAPARKSVCERNRERVTQLHSQNNLDALDTFFRQRMKGA